MTVDHPEIRSASAQAQEIEDLRSTVAALDAKIAELKAALAAMRASPAPSPPETPATEGARKPSPWMDPNHAFGPPHRVTPDDDRSRCERCHSRVFPSDFNPGEPVVCLECCEAAASPTSAPRSPAPPPPAKPARTKCPDCTDGIISGGASPCACETCGGMGDVTPDDPPETPRSPAPRDGDPCAEGPAKKESDRG